MRWWSSLCFSKNGAYSAESLTDAAPRAVRPSILHFATFNPTVASQRLLKLCGNTNRSGSNGSTISMSGARRKEKMNYMHFNPVKRGLVTYPKDWLWKQLRFLSQNWNEFVRAESGVEAENESLKTIQEHPKNPHGSSADLFQ